MSKAAPRYHTFRHGACRELNRHQPKFSNHVTARFGGPNGYGVRLKCLLDAPAAVAKRLARDSSRTVASFR